MEDININEVKVVEDISPQGDTPTQNNQKTVKKFLFWILGMVIVPTMVGGIYWFYTITTNGSAGTATFQSLPHPLKNTSTIPPINTAPNPHVYTLEVDGTVDLEYGIDLAAATKLFYKKYPTKDVYDFLAIFPGFKPKQDLEGGGAQHNRVQNDVYGICQLIQKPQPQKYGSAKLLAIELYPYGDDHYQFWLDNPQAWNSVLLEETSHQWLTKIGKLSGQEQKVEIPPPSSNTSDLPIPNKTGINPSCHNSSLPLLNEDGAHWSKWLQKPPGSLAGLRETRPWVSYGNNFYGYDSLLFDQPRKFHPFDLYLMGFTDKSEIKEEYLLLTNAKNYTEETLPNGRGKTLTEEIVQADAIKVSINDIIAIAGEERKPGVKNSQKDFSIAFIILTKSGEKPSNILMTAVTIGANELPNAWAYATDNRSTMNK